MVRLWYKNTDGYKDFEDFIFLFPEKRNISFDFEAETLTVDSEEFLLHKIEYISEQTEVLDTRYEQITNKNRPEGYAGLNSDAQIPLDLLPAIRVVDVHVVQTITERDQLDVDEGDLAIVTEDNNTFVWSGSQWIEILFKDSVKSVDGRTGAVTLTDLYAPKDHKHYLIEQTEQENYIYLPTIYAGQSGYVDYSYSKLKNYNDISFNCFALLRVYGEEDILENGVRVKITVGFMVLYDAIVMPYEYSYIKINAVTNAPIVKFKLNNTISIPKNSQIKFELFYSETVTQHFINPSGTNVFYDIEAGEIDYNLYQKTTTTFPNFFALILHEKAGIKAENGTVSLYNTQNEIDLIQSITDHNSQIFKLSKDLTIISENVTNNTTDISLNTSKLLTIEQQLPFAQIFEPKTIVLPTFGDIAFLKFYGHGFFSFIATAAFQGSYGSTSGAIKGEVVFGEDQVQMHYLRADREVFYNNTPSIWKNTNEPDNVFYLVFSPYQPPQVVFFYIWKAFSGNFEFITPFKLDSNYIKMI